jgi:hypothetical protein
MAPEQAEGREPDARTDVYGLGATLYHCLTGLAPFHGLSISQVIHRLTHRRPTPIARLNPAVPNDLVRVVETAMARDPRDRFADAAAMHAALTRVRNGGGFTRGWSFGRTLRRHRRWLVPASAGALFLATVASSVALLAAPTLAEELHALLAADRGEEAHRLLRSQTSAERAAALAELEQRIAGDDEREPRFHAFLAQSRGEALLTVAALPGFAAHLSPATRERVEVAPPTLAAFVPLDGDRHLRVRAGYAVLRILAPHGEAWLDGSPLVYTMPVELEALVPSAAIGRLVFTPPDPDLAREALHDGGKSFVQVGGFTLARQPASVLVVKAYLDWLGRSSANGKLFAEPGEPEGVLAHLESRFSNVPASTDPAHLNFWEAVRIAGFLGCRLMRADEWARAAHGADPTLTRLLTERCWLVTAPDGNDPRDARLCPRCPGAPPQVPPPSKFDASSLRFELERLGKYPFRPCRDPYSDETPPR